MYLLAGEKFSTQKLFFSVIEKHDFCVARVSDGQGK
jgi:hypothetical protein